MQRLDLPVQHADPPDRARRVGLHRVAQCADRNPRHFGVGNRNRISMMACRLQTRLTHEAVPGSLQDDRIAVDLRAPERHFAEVFLAVVGIVTNAVIDRNAE
jgi:hypothetical protein